MSATLSQDRISKFTSICYEARKTLPRKVSTVCQTTHHMYPGYSFIKPIYDIGHPDDVMAEWGKKNRDVYDVISKLSGSRLKQFAHRAALHYVCKIFDFDKYLTSGALSDVCRMVGWYMIRYKKAFKVMLSGEKERLRLEKERAERLARQIAQAKRREKIEREVQRLGRDRYNQRMRHQVQKAYSTEKDVSKQLLLKFREWLASPDSDPWLKPLNVMEPNVTCETVFTPKSETVHLFSRTPAQATALLREIHDICKDGDGKMWMTIRLRPTTGTIHYGPVVKEKSEVQQLRINGADRKLEYVIQAPNLLITPDYAGVVVKPPSIVYLALPQQFRKLESDNPMREHSVCAHMFAPLDHYLAKASVTVNVNSLTVGFEIIVDPYSAITNTEKTVQDALRLSPRTRALARIDARLAR